MSIKDFEYRFNLASTHTAKNIQEWCDILSSGKERPLKMENTISLYDFVSSYKELYDQFKEEYQTINKLNIGNNNNVIEYIDNGDYRMLSLQLNDQEEGSIVPGDEYNRLIIEERPDYKNSLNAYFASGSTYRLKTPTVTNVDQDILRSYLDLFGKYYPLFELYRDLNLGGSYRDGQLINFRINAHNASLINGLDNIEIHIESNNQININNYILIHVDLTNGVEVNHERSIAKIDSYQIPLLQAGVVDNAFYNTRINRKYLRNYDIDYHHEKIKTK